MGMEVVIENPPPEEEKRTQRLGNCEVCAVESAKYTCPKCELKTCCLNCVNIHKKELECDGVRNKVKFIPLQRFSNLELQNDFNLLEEVSNSLFKYKRDPVKNSVFMYNKLPYQLHMLRKNAYMRKTQLRFLPRLFTKHKANTSCVIKNKLFWRVEWVFLSANIKNTDEKLRDTTRLCSALKSHLDKPELAYYKSMGINRLIVLMKVERSSKFYILDNSLSICENLRNKCILEFPIFYVIFYYEKDMFEIADEESSDTVTCDSEKEPGNSLSCNDETFEDKLFSKTNNDSIICVSTDDVVIAEPTVKDDAEYSSICYEYDY